MEGKTWIELAAVSAWVKMEADNYLSSKIWIFRERIKGKYFLRNY
jgi:hypothetical protein